MNRIFTLVTLLVISTSALAWNHNTRVSISSMSNAPIRVFIDGQRIRDHEQNIRISDLTPGYHRIQIYRAVANQRRRFGNQQQNQQGQLIYNGTVNIRNGMHTDIIINRFGRVFTDEQPIDDRFDDDWNRDDRWNNNDNRYDYNRGQTMSNDRFQQLKQAVEREHFDDNKLDLLKSVLPNNSVSTAQVRELAQLFSFEQNKLEFAKFAYKFTADRGNYFLVNDVFHFGTSKTELTRYIAGYRD